MVAAFGTMAADVVHVVLGVLHAVTVGCAAAVAICLSVWLLGGLILLPLCGPARPHSRFDIRRIRCRHYLDAQTGQSRARVQAAAPPSRGRNAGRSPLYVRFV